MIKRENDFFYQLLKDLLYFYLKLVIFFWNYEKKIYFLKKMLMLKIKIKNICFGLIVYFIF